ncbi:MAG: hypothetical protein GY759_21825 [Chloroflexi bacterium]|nr:hypothetical protein [Chloroflexota bacterium]
MQDSTALPDLRVLPTAALLTHENADPRRVERLSRRILENGILKNPAIVAAIPDTNRFVVLDGANRTTAFAHVGIPHIIAQVVSYEDPGVMVDTWYHVVSAMPSHDFQKSLDNLSDLTLVACTQEQARNALLSTEAVAYIVCEDGIRMVCASDGSGVPAMRLLNDVANTYKGRADIFRASNDVWEIQKPYYPEITALVVFPRLIPQEIMAAAQNEHKIPSGISRHVIPARALNVNFPIGILMAGWPLERKRAWFSDWLMERMAANAIRYYAESTFTFNE